jgi:uncharacterized membrane protein required for colicin V production
LAPIEVFFGALVLLFAFIGLVRGFLKELGVTTVIMFLLFFISQFETRLGSGLEKAASLSAKFVSIPSKELFQCWFFILVISGTAFISYQGETLTFGGQSPGGYQGVLLGLMTGTLNGYLIMGSIWFFMHKYSYPIAWLGFSQEKLSGFAKTLVELLPISFLGQEVLLGQSLLLYLSGLLLLARVIR